MAAAVKRVAIIIALLLAARWAIAASVSISGVWKVQTIGAQGTTRQTITFRETGDRFSGEMITSQGAKERIQNVYLNGDELEFTVERRRSATKTALVLYRGKVSGGEITGTFTGASGRTISWTAKREGRPAP